MKKDNVIQRLYDQYMNYQNVCKTQLKYKEKKMCKRYGIISICGLVAFFYAVMWALHIESKKSASFLIFDVQYKTRVALICGLILLAFTILYAFVALKIYLKPHFNKLKYQVAINNQSYDVLEGKWKYIIIYLGTFILTLIAAIFVFIHIGKGNILNDYKPVYYFTSIALASASIVQLYYGVKEILERV